MSNVVQFLEALSLSANNLTERDYVHAVSAADFEPHVQDAMLKRDVASLSNLLGGRCSVMAFILPAEEEQDGQKDGEQQPDDGNEEGPEHVQEHSSIAA